MASGGNRADALTALFAGPGGARVLACDGYGGNRALVAQHMPELADALYFGHDGNHGDPLLGGRPWVPRGGISQPPGPWSGGILITWATITEGGVQVNVKGRRFSNQTLGRSEQAAAVLAQPERCAFTVFQERVASIVIPNLYAAGGAACWVSGASTWGYLYGNARWPQ